MNDADAMNDSNVNCEQNKDTINHLKNVQRWRWGETLSERRANCENCNTSVAFACCWSRQTIIVIVCWLFCFVSWFFNFAFKCIFHHRFVSILHAKMCKACVFLHSAFVTQIYIGTLLLNWRTKEKKNDSVDGLLQRWNECSMWTCSSDFESKAGSGKRRRMKPFVQFNSMHFCVAFYFVFILIYYFEIFPIDGEIYIYLLHMYERRLHAYSFVWSHGGEAVENECFMNLIDLKIQYNK